MSDDKVSERELDRALRPVERSIDALGTTLGDLSKLMQESIARQTEHNTEMVGRVAKITEQVRDSREDIQRTNHLLRGNGTPGLTTDVKILSDQVSRLSKDVETKEVVVAEKSKGQKALTAAVITGALAGLGTVLVEIVRALM